jgi:hypothetical protein
MPQFADSVCAAKISLAHSQETVMDEIERVEYGRYGVLVSTGVLAFVVLLVWSGSQWILAAALAFALALMASGWYVASKLTSTYIWQLLEAEARMTGYTPSKRRIWIGNLLPGFVVLVVVVYLNRGA